ncbi:hypothetical protein ACFP9V_23530 [Deinococcus radiopugnans]|uniref:hypothetical protein n=1 Tax=Deinococcus radiopugnans TaxID=57497 RepID=UPI0036228706
MLGLGLTRGTPLTVSADSPELLAAVTDAIRAGLGDDLSAAPAGQTPRAGNPTGRRRPLAPPWRAWPPPTAWWWA